MGKKRQLTLEGVFAMGAKVVTCRTCGDPIVFAKDREGRNHPVNANPSPGWAEIDGKWTFVKVHVDHFSTCPEGKRGKEGGN